MKPTSPFRSILVVLSLGLVTAVTAAANDRVPAAEKQGARRCPGNQDSECSSIRPPAPRACPGGGQSVATACCRVGYCGLCWSDCPTR